MILVQGAIHLDVVVRGPRLPRLGETLMGEAVDYVMGGKGANQAVAAARCGAAVRMAGRVGTDAFSARLLAALDAEGLDRSSVRETQGASGMSVALLDAQGDYGAVVVSGVNAGMTGEEADPAGAALCLMQNEVPEAANAVRDVPPALRARCDLLVVNELEARDMGAAPADPFALRRAFGAVIVTRGARGLVLSDASGAEEMPAPQVTAVSAHGAGDAFCGALAAFLADGATLRDAARRAQGYAARIVAAEPSARHTVRP